jgi:hypothetical protein
LKKAFDKGTLVVFAAAAVVVAVVEDSDIDRIDTAVVVVAAVPVLVFVCTGIEALFVRVYHMTQAVADREHLQLTVTVKRVSNGFDYKV